MVLCDHAARPGCDRAPTSHYPLIPTSPSSLVAPAPLRLPSDPRPTNLPTYYIKTHLGARFRLSENAGSAERIWLCLWTRARVGTQPSTPTIPSSDPDAQNRSRVLFLEARFSFPFFFLFSFLPLRRSHSPSRSHFPLSAMSSLFRFFAPAHSRSSSRTSLASFPPSH